MDKTLQTVLEILDIEIDSWKRKGSVNAADALTQTKSRILHALQNPPTDLAFKTDFEEDTKRRNWYRKDATEAERDAIDAKRK